MKKFSPNTRTVADIQELFRNEKLQVDNSYQRRPVWVLKDKVALVETILLKFVIPELFFWKSNVDPDTGTSLTHIVDGQQRIIAIDDFVSGVFPLQERYLLNETSRQKWGGKYFSDLSEEDRKSFWTYELNVVEIAREATREEIADMFKRLNLTNYNLNDQERRNSDSGLFASNVTSISKNAFWDKHQIFNRSRIRRMKDIEFCAVLLLLYRNGIEEQPNQKPINKAYGELGDNYPEKDRDHKAVLNAIEEIEKLIILTNEASTKFLQKRGQLYTIFSIVFPMIEERRTFNKEVANKFSIFVSLYENFRSDYAVAEHEKKIFDMLKDYKLASSEGLNKYTNRMKRFSILSTFLFDLSSSQMTVMESLLEKLKEYKEEKKKQKRVEKAL